MIGYKSWKNKFFWCTCGITLVFGILFILIRGFSNEQKG